MYFRRLWWRHYIGPFGREPVRHEATAVRFWCMEGALYVHVCMCMYSTCIPPGAERRYPTSATFHRARGDRRQTTGSTAFLQDPPLHLSASLSVSLSFSLPFSARSLSPSTHRTEPRLRYPICIILYDCSAYIHTCCGTNPHLKNNPTIRGKRLKVSPLLLYIPRHHRQLHLHKQKQKTIHR